ncbi:E3 ubiquitin-protein ligase TRIM65 isoform X1 [Pseudophryne corroboree]|uniref:E3 ubiquitin-protein ligase TRIM65 isoform X1 n=1 Tax=Pseudophryne corroboree TaxID=495146 RepID=UPI003081B5D2
MSDAASLRKNLQCSICLDLYLDPLSLICGHSYCQKCIHEHWDNEELQQIPFTCPDCRSSFTARPEPCKNVSLSMVVEVLREQKQRSFSTPEEGSHNVSNALCQRHNEELIYYCRTENRCTCGTCMLRSCRTHDVERIKIQSKQEKVKLANNLLANDCQQKSIEEQIEEWTLKTQDSKEFHDKLISGICTKFCQVQKALEACQTLVIESVKCEEQAAMEQASDHLMLLQRHLGELKKHRVEAEQLLQDTDTAFLQGLPLLVPVACAPVSPNIRQCGTLQMDAVNRVLPEITRLLQDELPNALHPEILQEENKETSRTSSGFLTNSTSGAAETSRTSRKLKAEPCRAPANMSECRVRFYKDYRNLTFDPETAHKYIQLSHQDCRASHRTRPQKNSVPESSKRFQSWQVMCTEGFSEGSHYWELELSTFFVELGVAYGSLKRTPEIENLIGRNSYSWSLQVRSMMMHHSVWHNNKESKLHAPQYKKIGVHLNCTAGSLTFYGIREGSLECLHSFSCLFSEKVYPVFWIGEDASVTLQHNQDSPMDDVL